MARMTIVTPKQMKTARAKMDKHKTVVKMKGSVKKVHKHVEMVRGANVQDKSPRNQKRVTERMMTVTEVSTKHSPELVTLAPNKHVAWGSVKTV